MSANHERHVPVTLDRVLNQDQTDRVEAVGIAVVVTGPLVTIVVKAVRKLMPQCEEIPPGDLSLTNHPLAVTPLASGNRAAP
jgi:hypothetical protein